MAKGNTPRISVLIPSLNSERFLAQTIDSVLSQSFKDWEVVFVDGGSTDQTLEIMKKYASIYTNIHVFSEKTEGPYHAISLAAAKARGEFIYVLAISDGYLDSDWFKKCMEVMDRDPEVSLVWGIPQEITEEGEAIGPNYIYAHFLWRDVERNYGRAEVASHIASRINWRLSTWMKLAKKLNTGNIRTFFQMMRGRKQPPQKREWFRYWLKTGQIFPDGNMCVARKAFFECLQPYRLGTGEPGDWMGFYFCFNSKGYLSYCIPTLANFGRVHGGQMSEVHEEYNDRNRQEYFGKLREFRRSYRKDSKPLTFKDRNDNPLPV